MPMHRTRQGEHYSEGSRLLWETGLRPHEIEKRLAKYTEAERMPRGIVSSWLYGERRPGLKWALRVRDEFGIEPDEFGRAARVPLRETLKKARAA